MEELYTSFQLPASSYWKLETGNWKLKNELEAGS
jgi:hypothetical protein